MEPLGRDRTDGPMDRYTYTQTPYVRISTPYVRIFTCLLST